MRREPRSPQPGPPDAPFAPGDLRFTATRGLSPSAWARADQLVAANRAEFPGGADFWADHFRADAPPSHAFAAQDVAGEVLGVVGWCGERDLVRPVWWSFAKGRGVGSFSVRELVAAMRAHGVRSRGDVQLAPTGHEVASAKLAAKFAEWCAEAGIPRGD